MAEPSIQLLSTENTGTATVITLALTLEDLRLDPPPSPSSTVTPPQDPTRCAAPTKKAHQPPCRNPWRHCQFTAHALFRVQQGWPVVGTTACTHDSRIVAHKCRRCRRQLPLVQ